MTDIKKQILVVAAHPDDDLLGAGGTITKHIAHGDEVSFCFLGDGETGRKEGADIAKREQQARLIAQKLGAKEPIFACFPDQRLDTIALLDLTRKVEEVIGAVHPDIVYTHSSADLNIDHQLTARAVLTACRPQPGCKVKKILAFETASSTEWQEKTRWQFAPTFYVDITEHIDQKLELLLVYRDELRPYPHPRSLEGVRVRAKVRGIEAGYPYAEAFEVIRILHD